MTFVVILLVNAPRRSLLYFLERLNMERFNWISDLGYWISDFFNLN